MLGAYVILKELGVGGMGAVYLARESQGLQRLFAIKTLLSASPRALARFEREAHSIAKVCKHPNIVGIHEFKTDPVRQIPYLVLDYVDGRGLDEELKDSLSQSQRALDIPKSLAVLQQVAKAMQFVHEQGVLHRDLKPSNILLRRADDQALVADFGLARWEFAESLTKTGELLGTPHFMAPEQIEGSANVGPAADIWALGVILYQLLTGVLPFEGGSNAELQAKILLAEAIPARRHRPELSADVEAVLKKALQKHPEDRYPSAEALADDLQCLLLGLSPTGTRSGVMSGLRRRIRARFHWSVFVLLALCLSAVVGVGVFLRPPPEAWLKSLSTAKEAVDLSDKQYEAKHRAYIMRALAAELWPRLAKDDQEWLQLRSAALSHQRALAQLAELSKRAESNSRLSRSFNEAVPAERWQLWTQRLQVLNCLNNPDAKLVRLTKSDLNGLVLATLCFRKKREFEAMTQLKKARAGSQDVAAVAALGQCVVFLERKNWDQLKAALQVALEAPSFALYRQHVAREMFQRQLLLLLLDRNSQESSVQKALAVLARSIQQAASKELSEEYWREAFRQLEAALIEASKQSTYKTFLEAHDQFLRARLAVANVPAWSLPTELHETLAQVADKADRPRLAFHHYLILGQRKGLKATPERYQNRELTNQLLHGGIKPDPRQLQKALDLVFAAARAGHFVTAVKDEFFHLAENSRLLSRELERRPFDPYARLFRVQAKLHFQPFQGLSKPDLRRKRDFIIGELDTVIANPDTAKPYLSFALGERAKIRFDVARELGIPYSSVRDAILSDLRRAMTMAHCEPDTLLIYLVDAELPVENHKTLLEWAAKTREHVIERYQRSTKGEYLRDRPANSPLMPIFVNVYEKRLSLTYKWEAQIHRRDKNLQAALKASTDSLKVRFGGDVVMLKAGCLIELGRNKEAQAFLSKMREHEDAEPEFIKSLDGLLAQLRGQKSPR